MIKTIHYSLPFLLLVLFCSCGVNNKPKEDEDEYVQTPENTLDWQGTYEGIMPAADCPGIYVLLAIDTTSYEMAYKYIDRPGIDVSMGNIKWNASGDSITLLADHLTYFVEGASLYLGKFQLNKIGVDVKLSRLLITQVLKEDKSGENAVLEQYSVGQRYLANFYFKDKSYKLTLNEKNDHQIEYTDDKIKLLLQNRDAKKLQWDIHPIFIQGKDTCRFTVLSPVNDIYVANSTPELTRSFDVLYLNGEEGSEVKILNPEYKYCFTLPQIEASGKAAVYYNNGVKWTSSHDNGSLLLGDQTYNYVTEQ